MKKRKRNKKKSLVMQKERKEQYEKFTRKI